jgi:hypothetical protein
MAKVELTIKFTDGAQNARSDSIDIETSYPGDLAGEHRVAHILFTELKVTVGAQAAPKHNAVARRWLEFPGKPAEFNRYFDIQNSQALWFELANLIMGAEGDLILAVAFKALEPAQEPSFDDNAAINDLYYVHDRKMTLLNQSVHGLIKVQDLVNRLLHESLGGDLVDTSTADWERTELTRAKVVKGLAAKRAGGTLSQSDSDAISQALEIPRNTTKGEIAGTYRRRLTHHVRPSVDYSMFFSALESRAGDEVKDAQGKVIGRRHVVRASPPVQYRFEDLHAAFSEYLDAVAAMLESLSQLEILRR